MKPAFTRWATWAVVSAGTAWAAIDFPAEDRRQPVREERGQPVRQVTEPETKLDLAAHLRRAPLPREISGQPFAAREWAAAPRALPSPAAKAPLPQFPFRFAGHVKQSGGALTLYLTRGNDIFPIRVGELIEGFRIDALHDDRIDVTFVAGGMQSSVPLSALDFAGSATPSAIGETSIPQTSSSGPGGRLGTDPMSHETLGTDTPAGRPIGL